MEKGEGNKKGLWYFDQVRHGGEMGIWKVRGFMSGVKSAKEKGWVAKMRGQGYI